MMASGLLLLASLGAVSAYTCNSRAPTAASLFTYEDFGTYKIVNSTQSSCGPASYVLYPRAESPPDLGPFYTYFGVPLTNVILSQTVPVAFVETLGARSAVTVASPYTTSACLAKKVSDGVASTYVSHSTTDATQAASHAAQVGASSVEAIISDPWGTSSWAHAGSKPKVICGSSTYETTPLGAAEWIKFFGYFFDNDAKAEEAFCETSARYACNSLAASSIAQESSKLSATSTHAYQVPTVLFTSLDWNSKFSIQMTPYKNKLAMDAGATYPDLSAFDAFKSTHWTGAYVDGFKFDAANAADFLAALKLADVIIDETYPNGQTFAAIKTKYGLDGVAAANLPAAFTNERVYSLDGTMDSRGPPNGGTDYYESRVAEPDGFLSDLISVLHPTGTNYNPAGLTYLRKLSNGNAVSLTDPSTCNENAARAVRAPTCAQLSTQSNTVLGWLSDMGYKGAPSPPPGSSPPPPSSPPPSAPPNPPKGGDSASPVLPAVLGSLVGVLSLVALVTSVKYWMLKKTVSTAKVGVATSTTTASRAHS
jgi:iron complex transport system substrate-binding protein